MPIYTNIANDSNTYDALIIGAGPAGLTASIYLKRANYKVGFIEKDIPGGKMVNTPVIENYPGAKTIKGADLALNMYQQAVDLGAEYIYGNVTSYEKQDKYYCVFTDDGVIRFSKILIIATGTTENKLGLPNEKELEGKGVSHCAICDGTLAKGQDVAIVGSGNGALANALYLSPLANHIYMINRSEKYKDSRGFLDQIAKKKNIEISYNSEIVELIGQNRLQQIVVKNKTDNSTKTLDCTFVFVYVGSNPATDFVRDKDILNSNGTIHVNENMETNMPGLFAIGDINKIKNRQITVATSDATIAALSTISYLEQWQ
ncbi:MAG: FAD-dependent oxidoreductase [Mycoplasmoidaceae bacterium]|nr:FAD-dependent oxidoreductase [Mycoplasmoidaceae bacterium]